MTASNDFERDVSAWFHADAEHRVSPHLDAVLRRTGSERQRPAWSSLERWLPVQLTARFVPAPRMVWLLVVLGLILALGATAVLVGSRRATPSPFGSAGIGTVLYGTAEGDIVALDTATNESRPLIVGSTLDTKPRLSPDGSKVVYERRIAGAAGVELMVANADGTDSRQLVSPLSPVSWYEWSPSSDRLAVVGAIMGRAGLWIVRPDGEPSLVVLAQHDTGIDIISDPLWLPNDDLLFLGEPYEGVQWTTLYRVHADGNGVVPIVGPTAPGPRELAVSPDGTKVAYSIRNGESTAIHIVDLESGADTALAYDGVSIARNPRWSPDGSRLVFERVTGETYRLALGSADGGPVTDVGPERPDGTGGADAAFVGDGTRISAFYNADRTSWLLDASGGEGIQLDGEIATPVTVPPVSP